MPDELRCFQHDYHCLQCLGPQRIGVKHVIEQATKGHTTCPKCSKSIDLREAIATFPMFGHPEGLFGLDIWRGREDIAASSEHALRVVDLSADIPYEGEVIYANVTPMASGLPPEIPELLAPQNSTQPWPLYMRFYVPPGGERAVFIMVVVRPKQLDPPIEFAVDAVAAFHRRHYSVACVMLSASVEASIRRALGRAYDARAVELPPRLGFGDLLERARMMLDPPLGSKLVGGLRELAKARNPGAHGAAVSVTAEDVARWMVDTATVYEWALRAQPL